MKKRKPPKPIRRATTPTRRGKGKPSPKEIKPGIRRGDCREVLAGIPPGTFTACVTDPPYELGFMGKEWDKAGISFQPQTWEAVLRVLKPGGFLLAFGGTRTFHRIAVAIENAGFQIRDCVSWLYGSGFPKSLDISKAIDKQTGAERGIGEPHPYASRGTAQSKQSINLSGSPDREQFISTPSTPAAQLWDGWGTSLKPAWEPVIVAMKPLDGTFADNALEHGVAGLAIDKGRIRLGEGNDTSRKPTTKPGHKGSGGWKNTSEKTGSVTDDWKKGRFPANVILDEDAGRMLDEQTGPKGNNWKKNYGEDYADESRQYKGGTFGGGGYMGGTTYFDSGGPSRFFYCAKANKQERGQDNIHPTVKPIDLMKYLIALVIYPETNFILDPFCGSGTTIHACQELNIPALGIELDPESYKTARTEYKRIATYKRKTNAPVNKRAIRGKKLL